MPSMPATWSLWIVVIEGLEVMDGRMDDGLANNLIGAQLGTQHALVMVRKVTA